MIFKTLPQISHLWFLKDSQIFRSPSRMAISRSYPRHFFTFREKEKALPPFFSFASFSFKKDPTFHKILKRRNFL